MALPIFLTLVVAFGVLLAVTTGGDSGPLYSEQLRKTAVDLSVKAEAYRTTLLSMSSVDRVTLDASTNQTLAAIDEAMLVVAAAPDDPDYTGPVAVFETTLANWRQGIESLRTEMISVADGPPDIVAGTKVLNALIEIKTGDSLYRSFVDILAAAAVTQPVSALPAVQFVPVQIDVGVLSEAFVSTAGNAASALRLRSDLGLEQVLTVPELVVNTDDLFVVTSTEVLTVKAVVRNDGNAETVPTELTLTLLQGTEVVAELSVALGVVAPGEATTVSFEELSVTPGIDYGLVVSLPVADGEEATEDNQRIINFRVNEPVSTTTTAP